MIRLGYTSLSVPASVYDYEVATRDLRLRRRTPVLGGYDPTDYEEHRLWATAEDGERIPISFVCRRGATADGKAPGDILFVHAGIAPGVAVDRFLAQPRLAHHSSHWAWMREPLMSRVVPAAVREVACMCCKTDGQDAAMRGSMVP